MIRPKLAAFLLAITTLTLLPSLVKAVSAGNQAPNFSLPLLDDQKKVINLASSKGKLRYLDFWASWCAPCRLSLPAILELEYELGADRLEVIAVNVDENPKDAQRFLNRFAPKHNVVMDPKGEVAALYELPGMPTSFVIDQEGSVSLRHSGFKPGDMTSIRRRIHQLLETAL